MTAFKKHSSVEIQNAPFTFAQNMSVFMNDRSLNAFGYNADRDCALKLLKLMQAEDTLKINSRG